MGHLDRERLNRLLGGAELAWLLERARRRVELGRPLHGTISRRNATRAERDAVARLFGRPPRVAAGLSVSLDELDALLRRAGVAPGGLAEALVALSGPVAVRSELEAAQRQAWMQAFTALETLARARPRLTCWCEGLRAGGLVKRLAGGSPARARTLLDKLARVLEALPASGEEPLSVFAARVGGSAHALDEHAALGTLALSGARALAGLDPPGPGESAAEARREAWAAVGVLCDELSNTVLTLALPGDGSPTGRMLAAADAGREPVWLTLRQLVRSPPRWRALALREVLVVENPSVVGIAARRPGPVPMPIVCTNGQPRAATMVLLRALAAADVRLRYHGDFDWGGLTIANVLCRRLAIKPWRFDRDAYQEAVAAHPQAARLTGTPVVPCWDPPLGEAMTELGARIEQELVTERLLAALADRQRATCAQ